MWTRCKSCGMYKMTPDQKCACNAKKFDEAKLSKKPEGSQQRQEPIKKVSDKKAAEVKERWSLIQFYALLAKDHFDENGDWPCEYCTSQFNIQHDLIDNRVAFAHILAKGDPLFKHLAMFKNNVAIVCGEKCHTGMDAEICRLGIKPTLQRYIEAWKKINVANLAAYTEF